MGVTSQNLVRIPILSQKIHIINQILMIKNINYHECECLKNDLVCLVLSYRVIVFHVPLLVATELKAYKV